MTSTAAPTATQCVIESLVAFRDAARAVGTRTGDYDLSLTANDLGSYFSVGNICVTTGNTLGHGNVAVRIAETTEAVVALGAKNRVAPQTQATLRQAATELQGYGENPAVLGQLSRKDFMDSLAANGLYGLGYNATKFMRVLPNEPPRRRQRASQPAASLGGRG